MHTHQARARKEGVNLGQRSFARGRAIRQKGVKAIVRSLNIDYTTTNYPTTRTGTKPHRGIIRKREAVYGPCRTLKPLAQASRTIGRQVSTPSEVVFDAHKVQGSTQAKTPPTHPPVMARGCTTYQTPLANTDQAASVTSLLARSASQYFGAHSVTGLLA